jgi:hypothetical protein
VLADKNVIPPFGVRGGVSGAANRFTVVRDGQLIEPSPVPGKVGGFALLRGDIVRIQTSGGGGHGDPLARDPARVAADVRLGYLTPEQACARYGVVLTQDGTVDDAASRAARERLAGARTIVNVLAGNEDDEGTRRRVRVPAALAQRLHLADGALVELCTPVSGASLRAWASIDDEPGNSDNHREGAAASVRMGQGGLAALGARAGDAVQIRAVPRSPA